MPILELRGLVLFQKLVLEGKLYPHLREIDETAQRRLSEMMP